jgi:Zn-dependent protease with chaperone function
VNVIFPMLAAAVAVVSCLVVGRSAALLVRIMRPAQAVTLVAAASLLVSLAAGITLTALGAAVVGRLTSIADGHWSAAALRAEVPVPGWVGALATVVVLILLGNAGVRTAAIVVALIRADRLCRHIRAGGGPVVMVDDGSADAYTIAGIRGCVVISQRLFAQLTTDERRVLTTHELSHLYKRHHLYVHIVDIAAAANPLLKPATLAVRLGVERWADEDAASCIGDRRITGRALARVALLRSSLATPPGAGSRPSSRRFGRPTPVLGVGTLLVASRVRALLQPAPRERTGRLAVAVILSLAVLMMGMASLDQIQDAIKSAAP